ncbi:MAG: dethiobiotin synthase [Lachnoclostridium sp.]|nr:dethiobiotin synthase [Lachnospira sp.]MCM1249068.1 dethiobiotin synthase [Lachnoclostridium sp.]MCM1535803.1 dethiobiotin synthase [Clostridium sp.]
MAKVLFVTGTGTDVGKTYVSALIVKKLQESGVTAGYYKAAMSGNVRNSDGSLTPGDALFVKEVSKIPQPLEDMCPYVYEKAVSPHLASRLEGNPVRTDVVMQGLKKVCRSHEYVTMEGSGGILCPICFDEAEIWLSDVIKASGAGCLLIADAGLGTINSVGLTAFYMKEHQIPLLGIIFNHFKPGDIMQEDNLKMCGHLTGVKVLACVKDGDTELDIPQETLKSLYASDIL